MSQLVERGLVGESCDCVFLEVQAELAGDGERRRVSSSHSVVVVPFARQQLWASAQGKQRKGERARSKKHTRAARIVGEQPRAKIWG